MAQEVTDQITQTRQDASVVNLGIGHPGTSLLPLDLFSSSATSSFEFSDSRPLQYGFEQGSLPFREALSQFINQMTGRAIEPDRLFVTAGTSMALDALSGLFTKPGDLILVEHPTYALALRIFRDRRLRIRTVPVDEDGLNVDALEDLVGEEKPKFLYTIPIHQNPSGVTMTAERQKRMVQIAADAGFVVFSDEVYQLLTYDGELPESLGRFVDTGHVCVLGSFSKILAPGLRAGWIHSNRELIERVVHLGLLESGGGLAPAMTALLRPALTGGLLEKHILGLRAELGSRRNALLNALGYPTGTLQPRNTAVLSGRAHSSPIADSSITSDLLLRIVPPLGGYFVWAQLPDGQSAAELLPHAREHGVGFTPGPRFSADGQLDGWMRLSFSYYPPDVLADAGQRLVSAIRSGFHPG